MLTLSRSHILRIFIPFFGFKLKIRTIYVDNYYTYIINISYYIIHNSIGKLLDINHVTRNSE